MPPSRIAKGEERRLRIVRAAAAILAEKGPGAVSHRAVAARADVPLASTTYYFTGLTELLGEAGELVVSAWATHVERTVVRALDGSAWRDRATLTKVLLDAVLPGTAAGIAPHYQHLLAAADVPRLAAAYAAGRPRIDAALTRLLTMAGSDAGAALVVAVVDGAAVTALSEGRPVRPLAREMLHDVL